MFRNSQKDQPTSHVNHHSMPPVVLPPTTLVIIRPFTSITQDLTSTVRVVQESVPIARVGTVQAKKNEALEMIQDDNDCGLNPDLSENILEDLSAMFADCGSVDEEIMQAGVRSIGVVKLSDHSINALRIRRAGSPKAEP